MKENYSYPLDVSWSTEELASVLSFFNQVEKAYEGGVDRDAFMQSYRRFKEIVPSKAQEKQLGREFEKASGYSIYQAHQAAKALEKGRVYLEK